jgi:hypothetical protein
VPSPLSLGRGFVGSEHANAGHSRHGFLDKLQPLTGELSLRRQSDPCDIAPGACEADHEPSTHRIAAETHHDRDRLRRLLRRLDGSRAHRDDDVHTESDEFACQLGKSVYLAVGEPSLNGEILAFDVPKLA